MEEEVRKEIFEEIEKKGYFTLDCRRHFISEIIDLSIMSINLSVKKWF